MRRKPQPTKPDPRPQWQIDQGAKCACRGTDDMCPCQNENPWPQPRRDYEGTIRTLELQQQTDRETIASLRKEIERLRGALEPFARAYDRWSDGGNLTGWQAARMMQSVDATRFAQAFEVYAARSALGEG